MDDIVAAVNNTTDATVMAEGVGTKRPADTMEGAVIAYGAIMLMAVLPVYFGSYRSVRHLFQQHEETKKSGESTAEAMTEQDAMMFPVIASGALISLYALFYYFGKQYINLILAVYFFLIGTCALGHFVTTSPIVLGLLSRVPVGDTFDFRIRRFRSATNNPGSTSAGSEEEDGDGSAPPLRKKELLWSFEVTRLEACLYAASCLVGMYYWWSKHWVANNIFGLTFAVDGIELIQLNKVSIGCLLLGLLFFYDVFWVFGTDVMVTVARNFEAPIKVIFPQDLLQHGLFGSNFAMLGLGDIVLPGIFISLMLRFDQHMKATKPGFNSNHYFRATFIAYIAGLLSTIIIMHIFHHAQPALLYLVPACLGAPLLVGLVRGELKELLSYSDHPEPAVEAAKDDADEQADKKSD